MTASGAMVQEQPGHRSATTACSCASNSASFCPHSYTRSPACEIRLRYVSYIYVYSVHLTGGVSIYMIVLYAPSVQDISYVYDCTGCISTCYRGGCLYYAAYTQLVLTQPRVSSNQCERFTYQHVFLYGTVHRSGL